MLDICYKRGLTINQSQKSYEFKLILTQTVVLHVLVNFESELLLLL